MWIIQNNRKVSGKKKPVYKTLRSKWLLQVQSGGGEGGMGGKGEATMFAKLSALVGRPADGYFEAKGLGKAQASDIS